MSKTLAVAASYELEVECDTDMECMGCPLFPSHTYTRAHSFTPCENV